MHSTQPFPLTPCHVFIHILCSKGNEYIFGLSKERPILGDHAKAHILRLRSEKTPIKPRRSTFRKTTCKEL